MPIRINYLAELQMAEEMRRRDPVKRAGMAAGALVLLVIGYCGYMYMQVGNARQALESEEKALQKLDKDEKLVTTNKAQIVILEGRINSLLALTTNRWLWGTALNGMQTWSVPNVTIARVRVIQNYSVVQEKGKDGKLKPAVAKENFLFYIDGRDEGQELDQNHNQLKAKLLASPPFKDRWAKDNAVRLKNLASSRDAQDPTKGYSLFTLECAFEEKIR
jgi:hypothetical protein